MRLAALANVVFLGASVMACGPAAGDDVQCADGCVLGSTPPTAPTPSGCETDEQCGSGNACANDGGCYPADQMHSVHVTWTVGGQPASEASCGSETALVLDITSTTQNVPGNSGEGWAPVPCAEGKFSFQKMPLFYDGAELDPYDGTSTATARGMFDGSGDVALDLEP